MGENENISKLLRLKRYEQPPPGYFDGFLREFHRRQRAEAMRPTMLELLWERIVSIAPTFRVPQYAYGAMGALAVVACFMIVSPKDVATTGLTARNNEGPSISLSSKPVTISEALPVSARADGSLPPHYVLQSQPVSNDRPLSF